jgi:ATP-dependent RNA helicase RhlE
MTFDSLGLKPALLQAVVDSGYTTPTPIQVQAIPAVLSGRDIMAAAQTGTGKTAGFTLPILQLLTDKEPVKSNHVRVLVLTPTRELAAQVHESIETYGKHDKVRSVVVFGGVNINPQQLALRKGCDVLVATPGRLMDLYQQNAVKFSEIEILVLDEADRMLDMGFIRDIRKILALLPKKRQNLMFSATFSPEIRELAKTICHNAVEIDVAPRNSTVEKIAQQVYMVSKEKKLQLLGKLLTDTADQVLVFSRTKHGANNMVKKLAGFGVNSAAIHGNKSQSQRTKALADFKANRVQVLVATDIAARGIDIDQLSLVINYDLPQVSEDYVHRIGRTGRAGASGVAVSLVTDEDSRLLRDIERLIKIKIDRKTFDPATLPESKAVAADSADDERRESGQGRGRRGAPRTSNPGRSREAGQSGQLGRSGQARPPRQPARSPSVAESGPSAQARQQGQQLSGQGRAPARAGNRVDGNRIDGNRADSARPEGSRRPDGRTDSRPAGGRPAGGRPSGQRQSSGRRDGPRQEGGRQDTRPQGSRQGQSQQSSSGKPAQPGIWASLKNILGNS